MKQVLTPEQMRHLQELGLELKQSLVHYWRHAGDDESEWKITSTEGNIMKKNKYYDYLPAYTLADIIEMLPKKIMVGKLKYEISIYTIDGKWAVDYCSEKDADIQSLVCEELIDAAYSRLCWCLENKYIETKEE